MALTAAVAAVVLRIWHANLHVPFRYADDVNLNLMLVKGILENGWYLENPRLGAPLGQELYDFPVLNGDHLNVVLLKLLTAATSDAAAAMNIFFLLTFPLAALTAFLALRRLGVSGGPALVSSSLYALLPYHFHRGETHLLLSAYYAVPLAAYLIFAILRGDRLFARRRGRSGWLALGSTTTLGTVAICTILASASGSFYYSGFAVLLLVAATVLRFVVAGSARSLVEGGAVVATILALSLVNLAPTLAYQQVHGTNAEVGQRQPFESELYSVKLTQLILPPGNHRLEPLARARQNYEAWSASTGSPWTEAAIATLGTVGTLGFLGLLAATLASAVGKRRRPAPIYRYAGALTVIALLVATTGGFSSVIGSIYPQLRGWNRLSIFIAFFSLVAVAVFLDRIGRRLSLSKAGRPLFAALLAADFFVGALDQTSDDFTPSYRDVAREYDRDRTFVRSIENVLPRDSAVFQLPYASFPEGQAPGQTVAYDLVRPYLHSRELRWSFGAVRGRPADWSVALAGKPLAAVVPAVAAAGFDGIYVDRLGYDDNGSAVERELRRILNVQPLESGDGRLLFFDIRSLNERQSGSRETGTNARTSR